MLLEYKTILRPAQSVLTEKKSEFIASLYPASSQSEVTDIISEVRASNKKAKHYCHAYILKDGYSKKSDDGEPTGTAGIPIFVVLNKAGLKDVVCVVSRYFGGILLGKPALTRAYSTATALALEEAEVVVMKLGEELSIKGDYSKYKCIRDCVEARGGIILSESFSETAEVKAAVPAGTTEAFRITLSEACAEFYGNQTVMEVLQKGYYNFGETAKS